MTTGFYDACWRKPGTARERAQITVLEIQRDIAQAKLDLLRQSPEELQTIRATIAVERLRA